MEPIKKIVLELYEDHMVIGDDEWAYKIKYNKLCNKWEIFDVDVVVYVAESLEEAIYWF